MVMGEYYLINAWMLIVIADAATNAREVCRSVCSPLHCLGIWRTCAGARSV